MIMKLTDEEKKALEVLNNKVEYINNMPINTRDERTIRFAIEVQKVANEIIDIANEVIYKQQKEIEELHKEINQRIKLKLENEKCAEKDFVYKGKIKEKMREIMGYTFTTSEERHCQNYAYDRLKELLEGK